MAMTQTGLAIMAALATLASVGMLRQFRDRVLNFVIALAATFVWALFGFASLDVITRDNYAATASDPMFPLVYLGVAFAFVSAIVTLDRFADLVRGRTKSTESEGVI